MDKMRVLYCFFFFVFASTNLSGFELRDSLDTAKSGDFAVLILEKQLVFLHVPERHENLITFEEITAPSALQEKIQNNWEKWLLDGAPGNILREKAVIDIKKNTPSSKNLEFLTTLLSLPLEPVQEYELKKRGPKPQSGEFDFRPLWKPPIIVDNKEANIPVHAWKTTWPDDGSDLAKKYILLYLAEKPAIQYFPYWVEVKGLVNFKIHIIDSGNYKKGERS